MRYPTIAVEEIIKNCCDRLAVRRKKYFGALAIEPITGLYMLPRSQRNSLKLLVSDYFARSHDIVGELRYNRKRRQWEIVA